MDNILPLYQQGAVYDRMFDHIKDADFYKNLALSYGRDCLEICCGTGRVLLELAAAGLEAYGLDYAQPMLEEARKKADERGLNVQLHVGDMRHFDLGRTFSTILIVANSFAHLYTLDDVHQHLECVKRHARPDTKYIVNFFNPRIDFLLVTERRHIMDFVDPFDNQPVAVYEEGEYDDATQIRMNRWFYKKGEQLEPARDLPMRIFFPQELDALLTLNGFRILQKIGNYDGTSFSKGSPHQILICETA